MIRITRTAFVYPDGQIEVPTKDVKGPDRTVEIDESGWVHVVEIGQFGHSIRHTSFPPHEIQFIDWNCNEDGEDA